jgi:hypothetical protein
MVPIILMVCTTALNRSRVFSVDDLDGRLDNEGKFGANTCRAYDVNMFDKESILMARILIRICEQTLDIRNCVVSMAFIRNVDVQLHNYFKSICVA